MCEGSDQGPFLELCLVLQAAVEMALPCAIGDYTDFYTGIHHATTVGKLFRPDNPLLPNYKWVPIGYHGRSSSLRASGHGFVRPENQIAFRAVTEAFLAKHLGGRLEPIDRARDFKGSTLRVEAGAELVPGLAG